MGPGSRITDHTDGRSTAPFYAMHNKESTTKMLVETVIPFIIGQKRNPREPLPYLVDPGSRIFVNPQTEVPDCRGSVNSPGCPDNRLRHSSVLVFKIIIYQHLSHSIS